MGLFTSTTLIVIFGEIIPQAVCSRYGLAIGARTIWVTKIFMVTFFIVAWPISLLLDKVLGKDIGTVYSQNELKRLITFHVENPEAQEESGLTREDHKLLTGALEYKTKKVGDVMTPLDKVYMLELQAKLSFAQMLAVYEAGFTRIPVYEGERQHIVGILFTKDLIMIDPDDELLLKAVLALG